MSGKHNSNPATPTPIVQRWLVPLVAIAILVTGTVYAGDSDRAAGESILYEIYLVETSEPVIALSTDAVLRAARGDLDGLINVHGAQSGTLGERLQAAEAAGALRILAAPRVLTHLGESVRAQTGTQVPIQTMVNSTATVTYINATLRIALDAEHSPDGLLNLSVMVQKQLPLFDKPLPGQGSPIETVDHGGLVVVRDEGTAVLSGFRSILRNDAAVPIPELVLLVTPTLVKL